MFRCPTCEGLELRSVVRRHTHNERYWEHEKNDEYWDENGHNHSHQIWRQYFRCSRGHLFTWRNNVPCQVKDCRYHVRIEENWIGHRNAASAEKVTNALDALMKAFEKP